jgi:hypothetical protein
MTVPVGTIVRILSVNDDPTAMGPDAWGVVTHDPTFERGSAGWDIVAYAFKFRAKHNEAYNTPTNGNGYGWYLQKHEYEIVPEDEVPDHIWAALAEARLTR